MRITASILLILTSLSQAAFAQSTLSVNPRESYLLTDGPPGTLDATPISLAALGVQAGDVLRLEQLGEINLCIDNPACMENWMQMIGVFSASDVLLDGSQLNRVQDAIDAGQDIVTFPTFVGNLTTDVSEDFEVGDTYVTVPAGAQYLFVTAHDNGYWNNFDSDGDFALRLTRLASVSAIPTPLVVACAALVCFVGVLLLPRRG